MLRNVDNQLLADIKERTGAHAVALVLVDSILPCPDVRAGSPCDEGHEFQGLTSGVADKASVGHMFNWAWSNMNDDGVIDNE